MDKKMSFFPACRDYFGLLPGETSVEFFNEVKALSVRDRGEIMSGLTNNGYEIIQPEAVAA